MDHKTHNNQYKNLLLMLVISFIAMYFLMYVMVNSFSNVYHSFNQFYMAGLMTATMVIIELFLMRSMYSNKKRNNLIITASIVAFIGFFFLIRQQGGITDKQFLRSMIPHHAGAILMCEETKIKNPKISELCNNILSGQKNEIELMKALLQQL